MTRERRTVRKPAAAALNASASRRDEEAGKRRETPDRRPAAGARKARADDGKVRVFISYAHADRVVAGALREVLTEVNRNRVQCFLDSESIGSGEDWPDKLRSALAEADWLVCVYTGEQSQFCGYEVGVFTQGKALTQPDGDTRLVCLHDVVDPPGLFAANQNRLISFLPPGVTPAPEHTWPVAWPDEEVEFYRASSVFRFLADFCRYEDLYVAQGVDAAERQAHALLAAAKRITLAFDKARGSNVVSETPTQLKLEVSFGSNTPGRFDAVPADARVTGTNASFALFGLQPRMVDQKLPSTTWEALKEECLKRSPMNGRWMDSLEREMVSSMKGLALGTPEAIFSAVNDNKLYRPILARHVVRYNGSNEFDLVLVPTLPRQFLGQRKTSLLLAGLVQASRFRFTFLEQPDRVAADFDDSRSDREFMTNCKQLHYNIECMESEAAELGVLDIDAFVAAFGGGRRARAEAFVKNWEQAKAALLPHLPDPGAALTPEARGKAHAAVTAFVAAMREENRDFVLAAIDAYREELAR